MLEDRSYMQKPSFSPRFSATVVLLIVNVVCFILQKVNGVYIGSHIEDSLRLSPAGLGEWRIYELITFQFLHGGWLHLIFNSLALYFFGKALEETLGSGTFLRLYFSSGILGGLVHVGLGLVLPSYFGGPVVGASAGVFGIVAAFALLHPEQPITTFIYFIPVTMKAKYLLALELAITLLGVLLPSRGDIVAHGAHLGGIIMGCAYVRWGIRIEELFAARRRIQPKFRPRQLVRVASRKSAPWKQPGKEEPENLPPGEFISREVDPILDKISAHGLQSLTERERKILEAARSKMRQR